MAFFPAKPLVPIRPTVFFQACRELSNPSQSNILHRLVSAKILSSWRFENDKLIRSIAKNISDDLQKHNQAHLELQKMRYTKERAIFTRNFAQPV